MRGQLGSRQCSKWKNYRTRKSAEARGDLGSVSSLSAVHLRFRGVALAIARPAGLAVVNGDDRGVAAALRPIKPCGRAGEGRLTPCPASSSRQPR